MLNGKKRKVLKKLLRRIDKRNKMKGSIIMKNPYISRVFEIDRQRGRKSAAGCLQKERNEVCLNEY
jgi:hypothetical protein